MSQIVARDIIGLEEKAEDVASLLSVMGNAKRLIVLCNLLEREYSVGELADIVKLSDAALSQHLAKLRLMGLVQTRRDGQTIYYRLGSEKVRSVLSTLHNLYCAP